ncbi:MAG: hypothetical protein JWQ54_3188 [Mucilaginibacter sp.]|nr:hypothetical protein [Mucilaginibacter sp.]
MKPIKEYMYTPDEIRLAHEIAERLNDPGSINQFMRYAKRYSHRILREKLNYVCSIPDRKITSSRAAYFVFLIEQLDDSSESEHSDNVIDELQW